MKREGIKLEKKPMKKQELIRTENFVRNNYKKGNQREQDTYKVFLLFRYTAMHPSVIGIYDYSKKREKDSFLVEGIDEENNNTIEWDRPKKKGGDAHTVIVKHPNIDFDVDEFYKEVRSRKSKYKKSRQYFWQLMKDLGEKINIPDISPLTFRHTLAVEMIQMGIDRGVICDTLNISEATLRKYGKFAPESRNTLLAKKWGIKE